MPYPPVSVPIILASGSAVRAQLLRNANVSFDVVLSRVDEVALRNSLGAEQASPRDIADALAEAKARRVANRHPTALVIGCDQVLEFKGQIFNKPTSPADAIGQLQTLRGQTHSLLSAVVLYATAEPIWRHVGQVKLTMRQLSDAYIHDYVARNWDSVQHSVGAYKIEEEGSRLFTRIEGDYFTILGLPLTDLLSYLILRGTLSA
jgi:septum formation protein